MPVAGLIPFDIARLRHQVKVQQLTGVSQDAAGQSTGTWSDVLTTRAEIAPVRAGEIERAHSFGSNTNHKVTIRYRANLTAKMRLVYAGGGTSRIFLINGIIHPEERNVLLELYCAELEGIV